MNPDLVFEWWNLVFVAPFGVAVIYLLVYAASGLTFGEADADGGAGGHDAAAGHDAAGGDGHGHAGGYDADGDADADADADADGDTAHGDHGESETAAGSAGSVRAALTWLGVGRVPLSILLMVLLLAWGSAGFLANQIAGDGFAVGDWRVLGVSLPVAALVSLLATRVVVRAIDRWIPLDETSARRRHDLLGLTGEAMYDITARFGMLRVHDDRGELSQVPCRVADGYDPIPKHGRATLVAYNARERLYHVFPAGAVGRPGSGESAMKEPQGSAPGSAGLREEPGAEPLGALGRHSGRSPG
jgi:membrane protein implicated in regulation of membrane protease activity